MHRRFYFSTSPSIPSPLIHNLWRISGTKIMVKKKCERVKKIAVIFEEEGREQKTNAPFCQGAH